MLSPQNRKGFTLVEILITIVIISLLMAVLLTAYNRALDSSKQAACMGNLKSLGSAISMYQGDHNLKLPGLENPAYPGGGNYYDNIFTLVEQLNPYMGYADVGYKWGSANPNPNQVWKCPADKPNDQSGFEFMWHGSSYDFQWQYGAQRSLAPMLSGFESWFPSWEWILKPSPLSQAPIMWDNLLNHRDGKGRNVLYLDMHVEAVPDGWKQPLVKYN